MIPKTSASLQAFVEKNYPKKLTELAFKKTLIEGYDNRFVLDQVHGKQKAKQKFPFLFEKAAILYPTKVSVEQSSSEKTAKWKANLVSGATLLDMTGGFGVDTFHFSTRMLYVTYLEKNTDLYQIAQHNFHILQAKNIATFNEDAVTFLKNTKQKFDWIYLDPARRDEVGRRKIGLVGYFPNLVEIQELLVEKAVRILVKVSPMLDIQQAIQQLKNIQKVIIVAVQNEVKELLFILTKANTASTKTTVQCVNLKKDNAIDTYEPKSSLNLSTCTYTLPQKYLYEPNAAILKAGLFHEIALDFNINKLHPNTHLYTSKQLIKDFPGRVFLIKGVENFNKKAITPHLNHKKANIATRNFPYSVAQIKKKLGLKDGGKQYLFAVTLHSQQLSILVCEKVTT